MCGRYVRHHFHLLYVPVTWHEEYCHISNIILCGYVSKSGSWYAFFFFPAIFPTADNMQNHKHQISLLRYNAGGNSVVMCC